MPSMGGSPSIGLEDDLVGGDYLAFPQDVNVICVLCVLLLVGQYPF